MPKIKVEVVKRQPEPEQGITYTIKEVEVFTSPKQGYKGARVALEDAMQNKTETVLWLRDQATTKSKLGTFIAALGDDTDTWIDKRILIKSWRDGNRDIELAPPA